MTTLDRAELKALNKEINEAVSKIASRKGLSIHIGRSVFTDSSATIKLEVKVLGEDGSLKISDSTHALADSDARRHEVTFKDHVIGCRYRHEKDGNVTYYVVTDYDYKKRSYPFKAVREDGKEYKLSGYHLASMTFSPLKAPIFVEFRKWALIDPDSDAVLESDCVICDDVFEYLNSSKDEAKEVFFAKVEEFCESLEFTDYDVRELFQRVIINNSFIEGAAYLEIQLMNRK